MINFTDKSNGVNVEAIGHGRRINPISDTVKVSAQLNITLYNTNAAAERALSRSGKDMCQKENYESILIEIKSYIKQGI